MAKKIFRIDLEDVRRLAALQCTEAEGAAFFQCSVKKFKKILDTMPEVFDAWTQGRESGKTSLRRKQMRLASTSASMAIHLGKNLLGQRDASSVEHSNPDGSLSGIDLSKLTQDDRDKFRSLLLRAAEPKSDTK